jgi:hypothetical protein
MTKILGYTAIWLLVTKWKIEQQISYGRIWPRDRVPTKVLVLSSLFLAGCSIRPEVKIHNSFNTVVQEQHELYIGARFALQGE